MSDRARGPEQRADAGIGAGGGVHSALDIGGRDLGLVGRIVADRQIRAGCDGAAVDAGDRARRHVHRVVGVLDIGHGRGGAPHHDIRDVPRLEVDGAAREIDVAGDDGVAVGVVVGDVDRGIRRRDVAGADAGDRPGRLVRGVIRVEHVGRARHGGRGFDDDGAHIAVVEPGHVTGESVVLGRDSLFVGGRIEHVDHHHGRARLPEDGLERVGDGADAGAELGDAVGARAGDEGGLVDRPDRRRADEADDGASHRADGAYALLDFEDLYAVQKFCNHDSRSFLVGVCCPGRCSKSKRWGRCERWQW